MATLLTLFSSSNSVLPMRPKAGKPNPGVINQPNFVLFGSAIPNHYYNALSERMLTNGLFARMLIVESGPRKEGQEPEIIKLSPRIVETAHWWADFRPTPGNLEPQHPTPAVVEHTEKASEMLIENRHMAEAEYAKAEQRSDAVGTTVWGRVSEQTRKLALIYAISENHREPKIDVPAVEWAVEVRHAPGSPHAGDGIAVCRGQFVPCRLSEAASHAPGRAGQPDTATVSAPRHAPEGLRLRSDRRHADSTRRN